MKLGNGSSLTDFVKDVVENVEKYRDCAITQTEMEDSIKELGYQMIQAQYLASVFIEEYGKLAGWGSTSEKQAKHFPKFTPFISRANNLANIAWAKAFKEDEAE